MSYSSVGLFAGIGGLELGLESAGIETVGLCEIDPAAQVVLRAHWSQVPLWDDVRRLRSLPSSDILSAGFPCQDLSQAGRKVGITGSQSSLVENVLRLMRTRSAPHTLILENVSYMLRLDRGRGMEYLVSAIEDLGMRWAYRVLDARSFGVPQRRQRVILIASRELEPAGALLTQDEGAGHHLDDSIGPVDPNASYGFYWTEGLRGLGWAKDAVPTVKGGSGLGIPSPPAVWHPATGAIGTPSIQDVERLQGFLPDWTDAAAPNLRRNGPRWRLVGNAVCVPMARWIGDRLTTPVSTVELPTRVMDDRSWPTAALGEKGKRMTVEASMFPLVPAFALTEFLRDELRPLSVRATRGFLERAMRGRLRFSSGFLESVSAHLSHMQDRAA